jgi:hypothetical protein
VHFAEKVAAGVVEHDVQAPVAVNRRLYQAVDVGRLLDVAADVVHLAIGIPGHSQRLLGLGIVHVADDDPRSFTSEEHRRCPADASRGPGDDGNPVLQSHAG